MDSVQERSSDPKLTGKPETSRHVRTFLVSQHQGSPLDVEDSYEGLLRQLSYAIRTQLKEPKAPFCLSLCLYGIRAPILGPFRS